MPIYFLSAYQPYTKEFKLQVFAHIGWYDDNVPKKYIEYYITK